MGDAQSGLVKHRVGARHERSHQLCITDVALDDPQGAGGAALRLGKVLQPAPHHVIDHDNLGAALFHQQIDDMGADEACTAGDEHPLSTKLRSIGHPALFSAKSDTAGAAA